MTTGKKKNRTVSELVKHEKEGEIELKSSEISSWIEVVLGEKLPKPTLRESLLDGVVLCKLVNTLEPGALKRFHKKPRMLAMKIENIGFFLATCKTRMNLPPPLLFQPTDIHDDSNNLTSMSKVLNVLSFLKGDGDMIDPLPDDDPDDETPDGEQGEHAAPDPAKADLEPDIEPPEPDPEPVPKPAVRAAAAPAAAPVTAVAAATSAAGVRKSGYSTGFVDGSFSDGPQSEIFSVITDFVNNELSIESKKKLARLLQIQIDSFEESVMTTSDDQLISLAKSLGVSDHDLALCKSVRSSIVGEMLKKGRIQ